MDVHLLNLLIKVVSILDTTCIPISALIQWVSPAAATAAPDFLDLSFTEHEGVA